MMKSLLTVLAVSSLVVLGACKGGETADETAVDTTTVQEVAPAPMPADTMAVDTTAPAVDTTAPVAK
ncbi:MAG: hypothetical protein FIB01_04005 [Gemmatimonadetes bacterium]|nr:hypothetical protein [Gemmatimonadota bacterium]